MSTSASSTNTVWGAGRRCPLVRSAPRSPNIQRHPSLPRLAARRGEAGARAPTRAVCGAGGAGRGPRYLFGPAQLSLFSVSRTGEFYVSANRIPFPARLAQADDLRERNCLPVLLQLQLRRD